MTRPNETQIDLLALTLARGGSLRAAARRVGIPASTARRWAGAPGFRARVDQHRSEIISAAVGTLARLASKAAATLGELLAPNIDADTRLRAARAILSDLLAVKEHQDLVSRLDAIEARIEQSETDPYERRRA